MASNPGVYRTYVRKAEEMGLQNEFLDIIERGKSCYHLLRSR